MKNNIQITTNVSFNHSFSREFGSVVDSKHPERKMTQFRVFINEEMFNIVIEKYYPDILFMVFSRSDSVDTWLDSKAFKSMSDAKDYIKTQYIKSISSN